MKLKSILAGAAILAAGAGVVILEIGKGDPVATTADVRAIRIDGECPKPSKEAPKCDSTSQQKGYCLCITKQAAGSVDGEVSSSNIAARPAKEIKQLVVCPGTDVIDPKTGKPTGNKTGPITKWQTKDQKLCDGGIVAADNVAIDVSMNSLEGDIEQKLRDAGCWFVTAGSWKNCPACLLDRSCGEPPADVVPK